MILAIFDPFWSIFGIFWHFRTEIFEALAYAAKKAWIICRSLGLDVFDVDYQTLTQETQDIEN